MRPHTLYTLSAAVLIGATTATAQDVASVQAMDTASPSSGAARTTSAVLSTAPKIEIQHLRPFDQRGINMFEFPKTDAVPYQGFKLSWGAAFTQQFQGISHGNTADPRMVTVGGASVNANELMPIGNGFNNANANLYMNAQLAPGIRVAVTSYLSARKHNETWVKDGYLLIDQSPLKVALLENIMRYTTVRVGHFEINYGDAHFRRTDNGNAMYNPFVGNLILDAFTTEIGGEVYVRARSMLAMAAVTGGEIRGNVTKPGERAPAFFSKLGFDRQVTDDLRVRLTGSTFLQAKSLNNTLYSGDRAGSRYYFVVENTQAVETTQSSSGMINPGFRSKVKAVMVNPFIKYRGLELFGVAEQAKGRAATESSERTWTQYAGDAVVRFLPGDKLYLGARYNTAKGELLGFANDVSIDRSALAGGWFLTNNVLLKGELVRQQYNDFPATDIRNGGKFRGFVVEGVVAF